MSMGKLLNSYGVRILSSRDCDVSNLRLSDRELDLPPHQMVLFRPQFI